MTRTDYTKNILNIKDKNIYFYENCLKEENINNVITKIFHEFLTYTPEYCDVYSVINEGHNEWDWKRNCKVKLPKVSNYNNILLLDKQRLNVKFIIIDLFEPYYNLFKQIFPNATIISDRFHIVSQVNNTFKYTKVQIMKKDKKNYKKLKYYWKLLQKCEFFKIQL